MMYEYGGHLPLELTCQGEYYDRFIGNIRRFNSGRSAICDAVIDSDANRVWLPVYYCNSVETAIRKLPVNVEICFYNLNRYFLPEVVDWREGDILIWCSFFGVFDTDKALEIKESYNQVIYDNAQDFYRKPVEGAYNVYSCRKFFGVADGAYLICDRFKKEGMDYKNSDTLETIMHLLIPYETTTNDAYPLSRKNEDRLAYEGLCKMSQLTQRLLMGIDYDEIKRKRRENYRILHDYLGDLNAFWEKHLYEDAVPLIYPFYVEDDSLRDKLLSQNVYVSRWWPDVAESDASNDMEKGLSNYLFPLPLDQRYGHGDMENLARIVKKSLKGI